MPTDYFADLQLEGLGTGPSLPSLSDSAFQTPRPSMSRRSSRPGTASRGGSSSPPPLPSSSPGIPESSPTTEYKSADDIANDETISILDPRRFTPTLHANLVSEILNLRRELDSKHKFIEDLESTLQSTKHEKDEVHEKWQESEKERRNLKRQFQQLEHGTLSALEELAKDRDSAKASNIDLRQKLEAAQKRIRTHEDDHERMQSLWDKDKQAWDAEKRSFERRVHITESRLKTVLDELAAQHAAHFGENGVPEEEDGFKDSGVGDDSDTASIRSARLKGSPRKGHKKSASNGSRRSMTKSPTKGYRMSTQSLAGRETPKPNGFNLADELEFDEEDEDCMELEEEEEDFLENELRARRNMESRQANHADEKAKRVLGLMNGVADGWSTGRGSDELHKQDSLSFDETLTTSTSRSGSHGLICPDPSAHKRMSPPSLQSVRYVDAAVQPPPPSPELASFPETIDREPDTEHEEKDVARRENRESIAPALIDRGQQMSPVPEKIAPLMISASAQTIENPPSPPATPIAGSPPTSPSDLVVEPERPSMVTSSTQTEGSPERKAPPFASTSANRAHTPSPLPIPAIVIEPPLSAPPSPGQPVLPPRTKNAGSQTAFTSIFPYVSASAQTEEILSDKRLAKLPAHLLPSAISSIPSSPEPVIPRQAPPKHPARKLSNRVFQRSSSPLVTDVPSSPPAISSPTKVEDRYPGNNDNGPLTDSKSEGPRRPFRDSSLFAGFADEEPERESNQRAARIEVEQKSPKFTTPAAPNRMMKSARGVANRPSPVPEDKEVESKPRPTEPLEPEEEDGAPYPPSIPPSGRPSLESRQSFEKGRGGKVSVLKSGGLSRQSSMRRSAMIQNGAAAHAQRSRTPSIVSVGSSHYSNKSAGPPFPVPDRASSRKLFPQSKSEGSQSPTPRSGGLFGTRRPPRQIVRKDSLRKVRSATAIQRSNSKGRQRSRSPSPTNLTTPQSPNFPPLPRDNIAVPQKTYPSQRPTAKTPMGKGIAQASAKADMERASQGTVVDAIAACMVGEWMYKYVRRRKSFGVPESPQEFQGRPGTDGSVNVTGNGVRHKRWVWLSPYERAVMWSSKQPATNSALMGKSGRKRKSSLAHILVTFLLTSSVIIQSVLDVRDDTPLPKNHGISEPFNRSILILTPARALKFTAMSRERHYTWLTALSFLAHSPLLAPGLADLPRPPPRPDADIVSGRRPSLDRTHIRDSVRIAKDKARPQPAARLHSLQEGEAVRSTAAPAPTLQGSAIDAEPISDCAEPPNIPRFSHGRKRSLTGPRLPSSALRRLAYEQVPTPSFPQSTIAVGGPIGGISSYASSIDYNSPTFPSNGTASPSLYAPSNAHSQAGSLRTSEASTNGAARKNFFDAVGTMRMEAFIEEGNEGFLHSGLQGAFIGTSPGGVFPANIGRGRRRGSAWSGGTSGGGSGSGAGSDGRRSGVILGDDFDAFGQGGRDPFQGF